MYLAAIEKVVFNFKSQTLLFYYFQEYVSFIKFRE